MKPAKVIWILEDDPGSQFVYEETLGIRYPLRLFSDLGSFEKALQDPAEPRPSLLIADLRLPGESFLAFLRSQKPPSQITFPFMVVSSVDDLDALRVCFEQGAIDYITKPFGKGELIVKVERFFSNEFPRAGQVAEKFRIDSTSLRVSRDDLTSAPLTSKEFQILTTLSQAPHQTLSRDQMIFSVWNTVRVGAKTLDVHLFHLRKKLAPVGLEILFRPPNSYSLLDKRTNEK